MPGPVTPEFASQLAEQTRAIGLILETIACAVFLVGVTILTAWVARGTGRAVRTLEEAVDFAAGHLGGAALNYDRQHGATVTPNNSDGSSRV